MVKAKQIIFKRQEGLKKCKYCWTFGNLKYRIVNVERLEDLVNNKPYTGNIEKEFIPICTKCANKKVENKETIWHNKGK